MGMRALQDGERPGGRGPSLRLRVNLPPAQQNRPEDGAPTGGWAAKRGTATAGCTAVRPYRRRRPARMGMRALQDGERPGGRGPSLRLRVNLPPAQRNRPEDGAPTGGWAAKRGTATAGCTAVRPYRRRRPASWGPFGLWSRQECRSYGRRLRRLRRLETRATKNGLRPGAQQCAPTERATGVGVRGQSSPSSCSGTSSSISKSASAMVRMISA